jgi:hypothetical protein
VNIYQRAALRILHAADRPLTARESGRFLVLMGLDATEEAWEQALDGLAAGGIVSRSGAYYFDPQA